MEEQFEIKDEYIELTKLLKVMGLCDTGGMAKMLTEDGLVTVDGIVEFRKRRKIYKGQKVNFEGNTIYVI